MRPNQYKNLSEKLEFYTVALNFKHNSSILQICCEAYLVNRNNADFSRNKMPHLKQPIAMPISEAGTCRSGWVFVWCWPVNHFAPPVVLGMMLINKTAYNSKFPKTFASGNPHLSGNHPGMCSYSSPGFRIDTKEQAIWYPVKFKHDLRGQCLRKTIWIPGRVSGSHLYDSGNRESAGFGIKANQRHPGNRTYRHAQPRC